MFSSRTSWNLSPNRFTTALEKKKKSGSELLDLTASNPTTSGLVYEAEAVLSSLNNPAALTYEPESKGLLVARNAVAEYYAAQSEPVTVSPENIILTTSTSEAYSFAFRLLCESGDEVLIPQPSYPLFDLLATIQDVRLVPYSLVYDHGWQIDFNSLRSAMTPRTRGVIVVHPNNPTGSYVKGSELSQLNEICSAHDLAIIADEVFLDYPLIGNAPRSFADNPGALTFTLSGLSKISGLPQMKVAWMAVSGPSAIASDALSRLDVIADIFLSMNAPIELATPSLLNCRKSFQAQLQSRLRANLAELDSQIAAQHHCTRLNVEGGWYATLRVPVTQSDEELAIALIEHESVIVHPGHFFDFEQDGFLILSLLTPEDVFKEGVSRILRLLATDY
ncbi:MAG: aminotransferase [Candidatus Angelobacter sp.]|jgi:alanine-synthesizing transaminase|nr:aminotransferase [Candidatus Angelobacter sp.]